MKYPALPFLIFLTALLSAPPPLSAEDTIPRTVGRLGFDVRPSYAFSSFRDDILRDMVQTDDAKRTICSTSLHLQYGFTFSPSTSAGHFFPGAFQGIGTAVNFMANPKGIGTPTAIYLFQGAPIWRIARKLSLYYEWNFGISMGWKPSDGVVVHSNLIVGSKLNAYINLGCGLKWELGHDLDLTAGIDLTHFSNGNTSYPNPGVNMAGLRIGITKTFGRSFKASSPIPYSSAEGSDEPEDISLCGAWSKKQSAYGNFRPRRFGCDLTLYGAWRKRVYRGGEEPVLLKGHFPVAGININPMWRVAKIFRAGVSADIQWDNSSDLRRHYAYGNTSDDIRFYRPPFFSQVSVGLSGRAELVMPIFSVNVGMGYNMVGPEEARATYQMANLKIAVTRRFYINVGYQLLNFQRQNNLMLGLGVSL